MKKLLLFSISILITVVLFSQQEGKIKVEGATPADTSSIIVKPDRVDIYSPNLYYNDEELNSGGGHQFNIETIYILTDSYNLDSAILTGSDDYMFNDAFAQEEDVVYIPAKFPIYTIAGTIKIPLGKTLLFEYGALIDVTGSLEGNRTQIDTPSTPIRIFTINSNLSTGDSSWAESLIPQPEWFGARANGEYDCAPAIQKCLDVFKRDILLRGANYKIKSTLLIDEPNTMYLLGFTFITPDMSASPQDPPVFLITAEPFKITGGVINIPSDYNGWVFDVAIERANTGNDHLPRFASSISNMIIKGFLHGANDFSGLAYNGIRVKSWEEDDYTYFSTVNNVDFYRPDTAIFLSGHPVSGMSNSWHWSNLTVDWTMHGIVLDERAAGHVFTNLIMQPNTRKPAGENPIITVAGKYNSFNGIIWDIHYEKTIHLTPDAKENWFSHMGRTDLYERFVWDEAPYKSNNVFSTTNPFEATQNHYSYYTMERFMFGIKDNRSSNVPRFAVYSPSNSDQVVAAFIEKWYGVGGNSNLETTSNLKPSIALQARTSNGSMINGFGTGITFTIKDAASDTVGNAYTQDIISRIYARRDGADNKGLLQFFTKGTNSSSPSMTIRNSGFIGIGTTAPQAELHVAGNLIVDGTITNGPNKAVDANTVKISEVLSLSPRSAPPSSPETGDLYVGTDGHIYCYLSGNWKQLD